jgi:lipoprotein-anchoring transpeptidase ErfK/SrfK
MRHRRLRLLLSLPFAGLLAGCSADVQQIASGSPSARRPPRTAVSHCRSGVSRPIGSSSVTISAVVRRHARAYRRPGRYSFASFGPLNQNGYPNVFRVLAAVRTRNCRTVWYRVQLPLRPNGVAGYVSARSVTIAQVRTRIVVDISSHRLTFFRNGRRVLTTIVAVGSQATPTPIGHYYVNQKLIPADTSGPFGPGALGISAFSNVLTGWVQGGPIAIHGTNEPWSIGRAISNGCIRVQNPVLRHLFIATPAGTPVLIRR